MGISTALVIELVQFDIMARRICGVSAILTTATNGLTNLLTYLLTCRRRYYVTVRSTGVEDIIQENIIFVASGVFSIQKVGVLWALINIGKGNSCACPRSELCS